MHANRLLVLLFLVWLTPHARLIEAQTTPAPAPSTPATADATKPESKPDVHQQSHDEITRLNVEKEKLTAEIALAQAKLDKDLSESKQNTARLAAQLAELKARQDLVDYQNKVAQDKELAELKKRFDRVTLESNIAKATADGEAAEIRSVENTTKKDIAKMWADMELEKSQADYRNYATADPQYLKEPLQGRKLILSDRRIALNGLISMSLADTVTARINYFNNRDREAPIFLVIDDSPGGSVMAGYKILKAMQGSQAPVYVVVKSFAASMAACIATLATKSYAYPNAVLLHHQLSAISGGNLTQQQEWVKEMEEWWKRLADPVAKKMGITREEFIKQMYANRSTGDWNLFADEAQKLKWVDVIVDEIEETGTVKNPELATATTSPLPIRIPLPGTGDVTEQRDDKGHAYVTLPRLNPLDCYWIYNPDGYFRLP